MAKPESNPDRKDSPFTDKHRQVIFALGHYHIAWSVAEALIEVAIAKLLRLGPTEGSIVTAGLMFVGRAKILEALLARKEGGNKKALRHLRSIMNRPDRVDLTHSVVMFHDEGLYFRRRKVDGELRSADIPYDWRGLMEKTAALSQTTMKLQQALDISDKAIHEFFQAAHSAAAKVEKSP